MDGERNIWQNSTSTYDLKYTMLDAWGWCAGKAQGDGMGRLGGRRVQDGEHVIFF